MPTAEATVAVTGTGLVTAAGDGVAAFETLLRSGRDALRPGHTLAPDLPLGRCAGDPPPGTGRKLWFARRALAQALAEAGLAELPPGAVLIVVGQAPALRPATAPTGNSGPTRDDGPTGAEVRGPDAGDLAPHVRGLHLSHACASAAFALTLGRRLLRAGTCPTVAVVGGSALNPYELASMRVVRALTADTARPFDVDRSGIVVGEGGGAVILERADLVRAAGRPVTVTLAGASARVVGGTGAGTDADAAERCVREALADADAPPGAVDYVQAHATGTVQGDEAELVALERVLSGRSVPVPVTSHKGAIGHLLHLSAVPGVVAGVRALLTGVVPPTAGLRSPLDARAVDLRPDAAVRPIGTALVNSFGFGGNLASLVLRRPG